MKLEGLYISLLDMNPVERMKHFDKLFTVRSYLADKFERTKHTKPAKKVKAPKAPKRKIAVTPEELAMMKKLGLV